MVELHQEIPGFAQLRTLFVQIGHTLVPYGIAYLTLKPGKAIVKFQGVNTPEEAYALLGNTVFAAPGTLAHSAHAQTQPYSLLGYQVVDVREGSLGVVKAIHTPSQQQLLGVDYQGKELLIPYHEAIIKDVVHAKRSITVQLPEGFIAASF